MTCAICVGEQGPFHMEPIGKNDAMVRVCEACATETPKASTYGRGYEVREGVSNEEIQRRLGTATVQARPFNSLVESTRGVTAGWLLVRVLRRDELGVPRDTRAAAATLRDKPWVRELRFLGADARWFLFERPGKVPTPSANPLVDLEQWRVS